ncbi:hypothetical protein TEA_026789 [Camellia sinensis var. sinensis]|uniref:Uncharacterized protein n=1 Tax=Camellia sinensis var. sinensis TaxID=542762 RepID=A0A4S4E971_CAMSN|nr:hypothetical protein TEA_026789 [Camellia sinensis var. sinensis]
MNGAFDAQQANIPQVGQVDTFTDSSFKGNPAAVCLLDEESDDDEWFQTVATSHFLFTSGLVNVDKIEFLTLFGVLIAKRVPESQDCVLIEFDLPIVPLFDFDSAEVPSISKALSGASVIDLKITTTEEDLIVVLPLGKAVIDLQPRFDEIQRCLGKAVIIIGSAPPGSEFYFFSRVFDPKMGINELMAAPSYVAGIFQDLVTGNAHCALAGY